MKHWIKKIFIGFLVSFSWFFSWFFQMDIRESTQALGPHCLITRPLIREAYLKQNLLSFDITHPRPLIRETYLFPSSERFQPETIQLIVDISFGIKKANANEQEQQQCINNMIQKYLKFEKKGGVKVEEEEETSYINRAYLSFRDSCQKDKEEASICCSNPNSCDHFALDLAKGILPLAPTIFAAYKGYKTSSKLKGGEINSAEFAQKMCDINNKMGLGVFATKVLNQASVAIETTCRDKIETCQESCNKAISDFKDDFRNCFQNLSPQDPSVDGIIRVAEEYDNFDPTDLCDTLAKCKQQPITLGDSCDTCTESCDSFRCFLDASFNKTCTDCNGNCSEPNSICLPCAEENCMDCKNKVCMTTNHAVKVISSVLLFREAYKISSANKGELIELTGNSNEKEVVDCAMQPNRTVAPKKGPGAPISAPALGACQQAVAQTVTQPPNPNTPQIYRQPNRNRLGPQAAITGDTPNINTGEVPNWLTPKKSGGLQSDDDDDNIPTPPDESFPEDPRPTLQQNTPGWAPSPGGGSSPGGGGGSGLGGMPGGGGSGSDEEGEEEEPSYLSDENSGSGFAGGDFGGGGGFSGGALRGLRPSMGSSRQANANKGKDGKNKNKFKTTSFDSLDKNKSGSIFDLASRRIQQFCSDYSCPH